MTADYDGCTQKYYLTSGSINIFKKYVDHKIRVFHRSYKWIAIIYRLDIVSIQIIKWRKTYDKDRCILIRPVIDTLSDAV